ncbi:MAG TPA: hypothetical protein VIX80_07585 [Candidatus Kapabacteria bacterium]
MKTTTFSLTMIALLLCSNLFAQTNGSVSARSLILTDSEGRKVTIIPQRDAPIGNYIFEVPLIPISPSTGDAVDNGLQGLGKQYQQAPADPEPYITFATGSTSLTNNRIAAAGNGISLSTASTDNGAFTITNSGVLSLSGTANQVSVSSSTGSVTLSLPQSIHSGASPTFTNVSLSSVPSSSSFTDIVVSNGGALQTRTISSLGFVDDGEPILTFSSGGSTLTNNRVVAAGSGIGLTTGGSDGSNFTIANTGVLSLTAGTGISLTNSTGNITVANTGVTSVELSMPGIFSVANSPVTTTGTLTASLVDQAPNTFFAGPVSGSNAAPTFRALDFADFDALVWTLQGNNVASGTFIGTTNTESFDMRVNGTTRLILTDRVTVQRDNNGDFRGFFATDMQAARNSSNQVASGNYSTISGGRANRASGIGSTVGGGGYDGDVVSGNTASARATTVAGGHGNEANNDLASIGGGDYNTAGGYVTTVAGGQFNIAGDYGATVAGGISNVAGTELAFVGGGAENNASGVRSVIGGGQGNNASGEYSTIVGGQGNVATGVGSVAMGTGTAAQGSRSIALGGGVGASGDYSIAMGGFGNAGGNFSVSSGLNALTNKHGQYAHSSGAFGVIGDAQRSEYVVRNVTADSTSANLYLDGSSLALTIPSNTVFTFVADITALSSTGDAGSYQIKGAIKNIGGTTSIVGSITITVNAEDQASWDVNAIADDSSNALMIQVQGDDATDIRWVASVRTTEVTY